MTSRSRTRWLAGRHANVDGIPFRMPVDTAGSSAFSAGFAVDAERAGELLPGEELHPLQLRGRGLLMVTVMNYVNTTIGSYVEFSIGIACSRGRGRRSSVLPFSLVSGAGVYIYDLPVSTEISVKGGLGIWGMPKHQANLDFVVGEDTVSSQYDLDGQLVMRIDIPRPASARLPIRAAVAGYGDFRGMLAKSRMRMAGRAGSALARRAQTRLVLGEHERARALKRLCIHPVPLFTSYVPEMSGVLDDHVETWFHTYGRPPAPPATGLTAVAGLGLSQEWLAPPDRDHSERLIHDLTPRERADSW